jgi:hypothetical protein
MIHELRAIDTQSQKMRMRARNIHGSNANAALETRTGLTRDHMLRLPHISLHKPPFPPPLNNTPSPTSNFHNQLPITSNSPFFLT